VEAARAVPIEDVKVDESYKAVYRELIDFAAAEDGHDAADMANTMLWAAHNLERAADRAVNICERVIYMVTGQMVELSRG
jgi:phosphate transport system protein